MTAATPGPPARKAALFVGALLLAASLVAVWASPVLVTTDGPSHVYNAMVGDAVGRGQPPYADVLQRQPLGVQPNRAVGVLLGLLGGLAGWETGERLLVSLIVVATFALAALSGRAAPLLAVAAAAWLSHNWFLWMGFYDFALSQICFAALAIWLRRPPDDRRHLGMLVLLAACYATHLLTFVVAILLAAVVIGCEIAMGRATRRAAVALAPAALGLLIAYTTGVVGGSGMSWSSPWKAAAALAFGDVVRTFHPLDAIGGAPLTLGAIAAGVAHLVRARRAGLVALDPMTATGVALLLLSPVAPESVGVGGYIPVRLQYLGVIALLPAMAQAVAGLRAWWARGVAVVLVIAFAGHTVQTVQSARTVAGYMGEWDRLLHAAGADSGGWVRARLGNWRAGLFRISGYRHLIDRIAVRRQLIVLDDYEAMYGVFPVTWRARPDWVIVKPGPQDGMVVDFEPGELHWATGLYLLYERRAPIVAADARLRLSPTYQTDAFAVTRLDPRGSSP